MVVVHIPLNMPCKSETTSYYPAYEYLNSKTCDFLHKTRQMKRLNNFKSD